MDQENVNLKRGEQEVADRLNAIRSNEKVQEFIQSIKSEAENSDIPVKFKYRIKENQSAINKYNKYIEQYGQADPEMWDSCGMMAIVEDIDEVYKFVDFFEKKLSTRENGLSDYVKSPKAGYRSIHMYSTFEADGMTVPSEIQIKTEAMSIAQDTVHDSVYKLQELPYEKRNELSTALFPIFEKSADALKFEKRGETEKAENLRKEVEEIRTENESLIKQNKSIVDNVWKEYGKVIFKHKNISEMDGREFFKNPNITKEELEQKHDELSKNLDNLFEYYKNDNIKSDENIPNISGDPSTDYAINRLSSMSYYQLEKELEGISKEKFSKNFAIDKIKSICQRVMPIDLKRGFEKLENLTKEYNERLGEVQI